MNFKKLFWIKSVISGFVVLFFINLMDKIAKNNDYYKNLAIISFLGFFTLLIINLVFAIIKKKITKKWHRTKR